MYHDLVTNSLLWGGLSLAFAVFWMSISALRSDRSARDRALVDKVVAKAVAQRS